MEKHVPALFGQKHSSRNYANAKSWGKNQFNSSFPASLLAYMYSKNVKPVYLKVDEKNSLQHSYIDSAKVLGINPLDDDAYYNFEAGFAPYESFYQGDRETIDLVMMNRKTHTVLSGLEIKLTALPDQTTKKRDQSEWSTELVVRPPTICFLACSICSNYNSPKAKQKLSSLLRKVQINHWEEQGEVRPHYLEILESVLAVSSDMAEKQRPLIVQPIWKTEGSKMRLQDDCLDAFVWSDLAVIQMCCQEDMEETPSIINRFHRTIIWLYKMLFDFITYDSFDYKRIIRLHSYDLANDKAFSLPGNKSHALLKGPELIKPRISKYEIKNIILGGGQELLSPERRFDAVLVNSPELFEED